MFCSLKKLYNLIPDSSGNKINPNIKTKQTNNNNRGKSHSNSPSLQKANQDGLWVSFLLCPGQRTAFPWAFIALDNI